MPYWEYELFLEESKKMADEENKRQQEQEQEAKGKYEIPKFKTPSIPKLNLTKPKL